MISLDIQYKTKDGKEVELYAIKDGDYPVLGAALHSSGWEIECWTLDGAYTYSRPSESDLVPVREAIGSKPVREAIGSKYLVELEVEEIPGYEYVAFRAPQEGEYYLCGTKITRCLSASASSKRMILRRNKPEPGDKVRSTAGGEYIYLAYNEDPEALGRHVVSRNGHVTTLSDCEVVYEG
jgi:hypothetical protein